MMVTYKLEQHLKTICNENREYEDLLATWNINKRSYREALKPITQNYPHYTEHGDSHSETILANIELLLGEEQIRKLSPTDTWLILQASYLHDIGMSLLYKDIESEWETEDFQRYLYELKESYDESLREAACYIADMRENILKADFPKNWPIQVRRYVTVIISDYYRQRHGEMSKAYIAKMNDLWGINLDFNGLIQGRLIELLGQISYLHTQNSEDVMKLEYKAIGHNADYIHPRFVAEMIRMGDLLDVDNNRFNTYVYKATGELPNSSKRHVEKHKSTRHILITPGVIEYKADCPTQEIYRETRVFLSWLIKETDFLAKEWRAIVPENFSGSAPKLGKTEILLNGQPDLNGVADLRFSISQEKAFQIIEGTNLYNDKYIYIRELIQNALDTCKLQMWRDLRNGKYSAWMNKEVNDKLLPFDVDSNIYCNYEVRVSTKRIEGNIIEITVSDNGTGISVETLKQMCDVGTSYWGKKDVRKEIESMPLWLRPTAGFGIGLQSVFLVTDRFEIISTCEGKEIKAVVESRKKNGFVQISPSDTGWKRGTKIILSVPEDSVQGVYTEEYDPFKNDARLLELKIREVLRRNCSSTYFPITLYMDDEKIDEIKSFSFERLDEKWLAEGRFKYKVGDDYTSMRIWDMENSIFYEIDLYDMESSYWGIEDGFQLFFKGMEMASSFDVLLGLRCKMDIYGMETKSSLSLNRQNMLKKAEQRAREYFEQAKKLYLNKLKYYFNNIDKKTFTEKWGGREQSAKLFSYFSLLNAEDKIELKTKYSTRLESIEKRLDILQLNHKDKVLERKQIKVSEILKDIDKIAYIEYVQGFFSDAGEVVSELQSKMQEGKLSKQCIYVIEPSNMVYGFYQYDFKGVSMLGYNVALYYIGEKGEKKVVLEQSDADVFYSYMLFVVELFFSYARKRIAVPALKEFADIIVEKIPDMIRQIGGIQMHKIISPLLKEDIEAMNQYEKEAYTNMILQREDFQNLLQYVYENQVEGNAFPIEHLREKYRELIQKSYEWYHQNKKETL